MNLLRSLDGSATDSANARNSSFGTRAGGDEVAGEHSAGATKTGSAVDGNDATNGALLAEKTEEQNKLLNRRFGSVGNRHEMVAETSAAIDDLIAGNVEEADDGSDASLGK